MSRFFAGLGVLFFALLLNPMPSQAQGDAPVRVTFSMHSPGLPSSTPVYITGGAPPLGNWKADGVRMQYKGNSTWSVDVVFNRPMWVEYRYTLGTFVREGAGEDGQPLDDFSLLTKRNLAVTDVVPRWTSKDTVRREPGGVTGNVRYHRFVQGTEVPPRDIVVWLPRFYGQNPKLEYPVLYLQDGQNIFDPDTSTRGIDWQVDEAVTALIADDAIEPMIVVGIFSGEDRLEEYAPELQGEAYMRYVIRRVKSLVDSRYKTRSGPEHTWVGGAAMGGLIAMAMAWEYPDVFGAAIAMSPVFKVEGRMDSTGWFEARGENIKPAFLYLDNGGTGVEEQIQPGIDEMIGHLEQWGYRWERDFVFVRDWDAAHNEDAWARRFPRALMRSIRGARRHETAISAESQAAGSSVAQAQ